MIRVAHISGARSWRGAEKQIELLLRTDTGEVENFLFCPQGSALEEKMSGLSNRVCCYSKYFGLDIAGAWKLKRFTRDNQIALLHVHDSHALNLFWAARFMGLRIPAVLTRHVSFKPGNPYKYRGDAIKRIICVSESVQSVMTDVAGPDKCVVIHPGIENDTTERNHILRRQLGLNENDILIGTVCALEPEKDLSAYLRIARQVLNDWPLVHFMIIGDGSLRNEILREIEQMGLSDQVHLAGFRDDVSRLLPDLDLFLFTSFSEGFPIAPAEAMMAAVPVVARNIGGVNELITDGVQGRLFRDEAEAGQIISDLLKDPQVRQAMGQKGRERAGALSVERLTEKTHNLYREILL